MGNNNNNKKNTLYVEANVMKIYAVFQLHPPYGVREEDFWIFFFENLAFWLPCKPIKVSDFLQHFCKTFVKISAVTQK